MEALVSGACVFSDPKHYWPYGVQDGVNVVVYHNLQELHEKLLYYLHPKQDHLRQEIGRQGRKLALKEHSVGPWTERYLLNDMSYQNEYGIFNQPW